MMIVSCSTAPELFPLTELQLAQIKGVVPQGSWKSVRSSLLDEENE